MDIILNPISDFIYLSPKEKKQIYKKWGKEFTIIAIVILIASLSVYALLPEVDDTSEVHRTLREEEGISVEDFIMIEEIEGDASKELRQGRTEIVDHLLNKEHSINFKNSILTQAILNPTGYTELFNIKDFEGYNDEDSREQGNNFFELMVTIAKSLAVVTLMIGALIEIIKIGLGDRRANLKKMMLYTVVAFFFIGSFTSFYIEGLSWLDNYFVSPFLNRENLETSLGVVPTGVREISVNEDEHGELLDFFEETDKELENLEKSIRHIENHFSNNDTDIFEVPTKKYRSNLGNMTVPKDGYFTVLSSYNNMGFSKKINKNDLERLRHRRDNLEVLLKIRYSESYEGYKIARNYREKSRMEGLMEFLLAINDNSVGSLTKKNSISFLREIFVALSLLISQMITLIIIVARDAYLVFFGIMGPIYLSLAPIDGMNKISTGWFKSVFSVWFWGVLLAMFLNLQNILYTSMYSVYTSYAISMLLIVYNIVVILMMLKIPRHIPNIIRGQGGGLEATQTMAMVGASMVATSMAFGGQVATGMTKGSSSKGVKRAGRMAGYVSAMGQHTVASTANLATGRGSYGRIGGNNFGISDVNQSYSKNLKNKDNKKEQRYKSEEVPDEAYSRNQAGFKPN